METIKKFYYMDVYNKNEKYLGYIQDVGINFFQKKIDFFLMMPQKIFSKPKIINNKNVISYSNNMVIDNCEKGIKYGFRQMKNIVIENFNGKMIGTINDIVIDYNLGIIGILISPGVIKKYYNGVAFVKIDDLLIENKKIYYMKDEKIIEFKSMFNERSDKNTNTNN